ncbi:serine hydrolase [Paludibaculum fermentans]|uniref:serine hydrolase n=1 Tax=Paludibaculum fermentans TaxID=1473598 RepID=UPI003EBADE0A
MSIPEFVAYHGKSSAEHQKQFDKLSPAGFRIISLSVYGDPDSASYAAVWVKQSGPAWAAIHNMDATAYQKAFDDWTKKGYLPRILSVTGSGSDLKFAGTFEKGKAPVWLCKFGLTDGGDTLPGSLAFFHKWAIQNNCIPISVSIYGSGSDRRYAAVWMPNDNRVMWGWRGAETSDGYQQWFNAFTQIPFRPDYVAVSDNKLYCSIFRGDGIGDWQGRHNMTSAGYQAEFDKLTKQGYLPIRVQGGGSGGGTRYAALFTKQVLPDARVWTATGAASAKLVKFDNAIKAFMQSNGVRSGQFAIGRAGKVVYARGYTWAEPGWMITQPTSMMRLASISKAFACAGIQACYDKKILKKTDKIFPLLGITSKALSSQTPNAKIDTITIQNLIDHAGGWDSTMGFDAVFSMRKIALDLGLNGPVSKRDIARYMYGEPLQFAPGSKTQYSNLGYLLMGLAIEKVSGQGFLDFVKKEVLTAEGLNDEVFVSLTRRDQKRADEMPCDDPGLGLPAQDPQSSLLAPYCYGGEGWMSERMDSGGGLCSSASALVRFISRHAAWGVGGRAAGSARSGGMAGVSSLMVSRGDGVDYAYIFNTRKFPAGPLTSFDTQLSGLFDTVTIPA